MEAGTVIRIAWHHHDGAVADDGSLVYTASGAVPGVGTVTSAPIRYDAAPTATSP